MFLRQVLVPIPVSPMDRAAIAAVSSTSSCDSAKSLILDGSSPALLPSLQGTPSATDEVPTPDGYPSVAGAGNAVLAFIVFPPHTLIVDSYSVLVMSERCLRFCLLFWRG